MTYDKGTMYCATDNLDGETGHRHHWHYRHGAPAAVTKQRKNVLIPLVLMCHLTFTPSTVKASSSPSTASATYQYNKNQDYDIIRHDQGYRVLSHQYESESKIVQQQQQHTILHGIKKGNEDDIRNPAHTLSYARWYWQPQPCVFLTCALPCCVPCVLSPAAVLCLLMF